MKFQSDLKGIYMQMLRASFVCILISCVSYPITLQAEIYKWTDEKGQVHYSGTKPQSHAHEKVKVHIKKAKENPPQSAMPREVLEQQDRNEHVKGGADERQQRKESIEKKRQEYIESRNALRRDGERKKKKADKKLVEECKRNRDVYCDEGAESIRKTRKLKEIRQKLNESRHKRLQEYTPRRY